MQQLIDGVVGVLLDVVPRRGDQLVEDRRVHRGRRSAKAPPGCGGVPAGRDEPVDDLPMLVDRPVRVPPDAAGLDVGLIGEPPVTGRMPAEPGRIREERGAALHPPADRDVVDLDAAFEEQVPRRHGYESP